MSSLEFSVILCSFNRAQTLKRCLDSFCNQTMPVDRWEMVLVNDGSTDDTEKIVHDFCSPYILRSITQKNTGLAGARNTAIREAKGKYLLFVNDDTIADPILIRKHWEAHHQREHVLVLGSFEYEPWALKSVFMQAVAKSTVVFGYADLVPGEVYDYMFSYTCNLSAPARCYQDAGLFDTSFKSYGAEDTEMGYRLEKLGYRVLYYPEASAAHAHALTMDEFIRRQVNVGSNFAKLFRIHPEVARQPRWSNLSQMSRFQLECHLESQVENTKKAERHLRDLEDIWRKGSAEKKKDIVDLFLPLLKQISSYYWTAGLVKGMRNENLESFYELEDKRLPKAARLCNQGLESGIAVSVIIPTYNRLGVLQKCLSALKEQTLAPDRFEVLICDDGSTDGTQSFMESFSAPFSTSYLPSCNKGPGAARNRGISVAAGKIALIINDDTILAPDALERHMGCHQEMYPTEVAVLGGYWTSPDYENNPIQCIIDELFFPREELEPNRLHDFRAFWTCNLSLPLKMLKGIGGFDENFYLPASEDTDLGIRLSEKYGLKILYKPGIRAVHQHEHSFESFKRSCIVRGRMTYHLVVKHPWLIPKWLGVSELDGHGVAKFREMLTRASIGTENLEKSFRALEQLFSQNYGRLDLSAIRRLASHYRPGLAKLHHYYNRSGTLTELDRNQQKLNMLFTDNHFFKHLPLRNAWDDRKTISVILPASADQDVKNTIASLKFQTLRSWEAIIVDRSREGVFRSIAKEMVLQSFAFHYLHLPEGDIASSVRSAAEMASGKLLMMLYPGAIMDETFLRIVYENSRDNLAGVLVPNEISISGNGSHSNECYGSVFSQFSPIPSLLWRRFFPSPAKERTWWQTLCKNITNAGFPVKRIPRAIVKCPSELLSPTPEIPAELALTEAVALLMTSPNIRQSILSSPGQFDLSVATTLTVLAGDAKANGHEELSNKIDEIVKALREACDKNTKSQDKKLAISVVIPTYNRKSQLDRCLQMLLRQSLESNRFEVIVVDDGSDDGTQNKFETAMFPFTYQYIKQENKGPGSARNTGVKYAKSDLILFLGDDTYAAPDLLIKHVNHHRYFSGENEVLLGHIEWAHDLAVSPFMHFITGPKGAQFAFGSISDEENVDYLYFYTSNISIKKQFLCLEQPIFDENFRYAAFEDIDLGLRLKHRGMRLRYRPDVVACHDHPTTVERFAERQHRAGQMAVVFARKHPGSSIGLEIDRFLHPDFAEPEKWSDKVFDQKLHQEVAKLEALANAEGGLNYKNNVKLRQLWSGILQRAYIQGVLSEVGRERSTGHHVGSEKLKASIIIPHYNRCELLKKCIASIQECTPSGKYEIIVVDNGSTDTSVELLKGYERAGLVKCIFNPGNLGFAVGCNQGAGAAQGKYLLFLNNDTEVQSGWFESLITVAECDETIGVVGSKLLFPEGRIQHAGVIIVEAVGRDPLLGTHAFYRAPGNLPEANKRMVYQAVTAACMLVRKKAFQAVGGFDEKYWNGYEDVDFCLRLQEVGWITVYEPASSVIHHESQSGPERFKKSHKNIKRFHEKWIGKTSLDYISGVDGKLVPSPTTKIREYHAPVSSPATVSIVVLTYNQLQYTQKCFSSILAHTLEPHEIIFVDNGSTDGTVKWLRSLVRDNVGYKLIENKKNLGFAKGCNQGIGAASCEFIVLLNNDVLVTEGWLSGLMECLKSAPDVGIVGPMTNNISGVQKVPAVGYDSIDGLDRFAEEFRDRNRNRRIVSPRVVGFCMLFRKRLIQEIGLIDETFGTGNFEDDDFCLRSILAGYRNFIAGDVFIHHFGSQSFIGNKIDYASSLSGNRKIFHSKWTMPKVLRPYGSKPLIADALQKGESLHRKGQTDQAITRMIDAIKRNPEEDALIYQVAGLLIEASRCQEAKAILDAMSIANDSKKLVLMGQLADKQGQNERAVEFVDKALVVDSTNVGALCLKGVLNYRKGDKIGAETLFRKAIAIDPSYGESYTNLGVMKWEAGEREESLPFFERGFILSPTDSEIAIAYHSVIVETEGYQRAEHVFREACALYPDDRRLSFMYIAVLIQLEKNEASMTEIERAMGAFGIDNGVLAAALKIRERIGPIDIKRTSASSPTLSVCMIARDEEANMARCLGSLKGLADEVIVVDTGSQDRTRDIARVLGAKVADFEWNEDFSAARNHALSLARGTWILVIDADEALAESDHDGIRRLIRKKADRRTAFRLTTRNYTDDAGIRGWVANDGTYAGQESGKGWYPSIKVRLFPRNSAVKFVHPVHEMVEPTLKNANFVVKDCIVPVHHYGRLDADKVISKGRTYFRLGFEKLKEMKGDCQALRELGIQASEIGNYEEAVNIWSEFIKIQPHDANALMNLGYALLKLRRFSDAEEFSAKALNIDPACREAALNLAAVYLINGDTERSVAVLEKLIKDNPEYPPALGRLAVGYFIEGKAQMGFNCLNKLANKGFDIAGVIEKQAQELFENGRITQAGVLLESCLKGGITSDDIQRLLDKCRSAKTETIPISVETLPQPPERQDTVSAWSALAG
jgi:GT2 family glycosyltransferase/lipopolysaccharide biosynthesis regulator YciM